MYDNDRGIRSTSVRSFQTSAGPILFVDLQSIFWPEGGRRKRKKSKKWRERGGARGEDSELLRRPEAGGGRAIVAGCSSSFFDLGLAY